MYFRKLLFESNDDKFCFRRVKRKKTCGHAGIKSVAEYWRWAIL